MPVETKNEVSQYFQLIVQKRFGDAEKKLDGIRQTAKRSEQEQGYLKALEGLLLTYRSSGDKYPFFNNVELTAKSVETMKKEFNEQSTYPLYGNYDKGYFSALGDFMKTIAKLRPWRDRQSADGEQKAVKEKPG